MVNDQNEFYHIRRQFFSDAFRDQTRAEINVCRDAWEKRQDGDAKKLLLRRACEMMLCSNMSFRGNLNSPTMTLLFTDEKKKFQYRIAHALFPMAERMRRTQVFNYDFERIFDMAQNTYHYKSKFYFVDPPYFEMEGYHADFSWDDYVRLNKTLQKIPQSDYFIITTNDHPKICDLFNWLNCRRIEITYKNNTDKTGTHRERKFECIFTPKWNLKLSKPKSSIMRYL